MQKKLIALAVAGLISAPVMAQSNVQIYGIVDMGASYLGSGAAAEGNSMSSRGAIESGLQSASRIGFRGTEDLGNGLNAFFQIEQGLAGERAGINGGNRQTVLGLRGDFGTVSVGRQWAPARQFVSRIDPFSNDLYAAADNFYLTQNRIDNSIIYATPNFNGFQLEAAYSANFSGDEQHRISSEDPDFDASYWGITPTYENGPLVVGGSYYRISTNDGNVNPFGVGGDVDTRSSWDLGAAWDFGSFELSALIGREKADYAASGAGSDSLRQWLVGFNAPVSEAGTVMGSYTRSRFDDARGGKWSLGYTHALSQRTNLYVSYSDVNTNSDGEGLYSAAGFGPDGINDDDFATAYESAFAVGIRHRF